MWQRNIDNYFSHIKNTNTDISSSGSECEDSVDVNKYVDSSKPIKYYSELLQTQSELKKVAKVVVTTNCISECWKYFGQLYLKDRVILEKYKFCKLCLEGENLVLKGFGKSTSTTNYINHLRLTHDVDVKTLNFKKNADLTNDALNPNFKKSNKFLNARRIAEMCCTDLQPFNIVERQGFKKYVSFLNSKLEMPRGTTIATSALNDVYNVYFNHVKDILIASPNHICIVLDMWSDKFKRLSYINIKVHFAEDFVMQVVTLKTEVFQRPHTGAAVCDKITNAISEFGLCNKKLCAVTDGGSNIKSALKIKNIKRFDCLAHSLHRFVAHDILSNKEFENINGIISKLKQIYRSLMYSADEISKLQALEGQQCFREILLEVQKIVEEMDNSENYPSGDDKFDQINFNIERSSLKNSVPTRWNSLLVMLRSFVANIEIVNIALIKIKQESLIIPSMEKEIIKEFCNFLQIFEKATNYLQGQKYPTISSVIYFYENIMDSLQKSEMESCFELTIRLCNYCLKNFSKRFQILKLHVVAALLDPCQKNWTVIEKYLNKISTLRYTDDLYVLQNKEEQSITREELIRKELAYIDVNEEPSTSLAVQESAKKKAKISNTRQEMLSFLSSSSIHTVDCIENEVQKYFNISVPEIESIDWWIQNKQKFPNVAKLANIYFGIPATSASSEQAFSSAGSCINEKRSRLNPATVKKQLFVHDNIHIVQPKLSNTVS